MITVIYGDPGVGKDSLMSAMIHDIYFNEWVDMMHLTYDLIDEANETRLVPLSYPKKAPIYTDFDVKIHIGFEKYYKPYFINGYYFGLRNNDLPVIPVVPGAKIFLTEVQRYYDSRKNATLPDFVSRAYEMHRHPYYDIYLNLQRLSLLDLNIRDISGRFILLEKLTHKYNDVGEIISSRWVGKEFKSHEDCTAYIETGRKCYIPFEYNFDGNVFDLYDSFSNKDKYLPVDGEDFLFLEHGVDVPPEDPNAKYYDFLMPDGYRSKNGKSKKS